MKGIYITIVNLKTNKTFKKYFDTEFERDKYVRRSKYFKNIMVLSGREVE